MPPQNDSQSYHEKLSSAWTEALFLVLMLLFGGLFIWRIRVASLDALAIVLFCCCILFLFYVINYRTLSVEITSGILRLRFGLFTWTERLGNIESCTIDELPWWQKYGGAGIHFMSVRKRYRASFNFLEYPRLVLAFKQKRGWVRDLSFSTCEPEKLLQLIRGVIKA